MGAAGGVPLHATINVGIIRRRSMYLVIIGVVFLLVLKNHY
jgi:hypothetical protein